MNKLIPSKDLSILFSSFDRNDDLWPITNHFFEKYWSNCPYTIFLGANGANKKESCPTKWQYINLGPDHSWRQSLQDYLSQISSPYVLLFVDDTALIDFPVEEDILEVMELMRSNRAVMCRLGSYPKPDTMLTPLIASWTNVIWDKEFLLKLLAYPLNPWEFEIKGGKTELAKQHLNDFYACKKKVIQFFHFVEKGQFDPRIKKMLGHEKVNFDLTQRSFLSYKKFIQLQLGTFRGALQRLIPSQYRNSFRTFLGFKAL
jgi:hypothetical protein